MNTHALSRAFSDLERIQWEACPGEIDTPLGPVTCSYDEDEWGPYVILDLELPNPAWFVETGDGLSSELFGLRFYY